MAGYVIHLAVAEEYIRKHKEEINNYDEFIQGVIAPDNVSDKSLTHYGEKSSKVNLKKYLDTNMLDTDYQKGYFLHLVTDYLFYNKYLECFSKDIYEDYDKLNKDLIEKYKVRLPEKVKDSVFFKEGDTKILSLQLTIKCIDEISQYDLIKLKEDIQNNLEVWTSYKQLKKI